mmetsp:Transcript_73708/g.208756  ORF Transcript_73708/g.208756 Transcript_73708/m.208756 type:complete len:255 (+) Transcript_73708:5221-5985(+)
MRSSFFAPSLDTQSSRRAAHGSGASCSMILLTPPRRPSSRSLKPSSVSTFFSRLNAARTAHYSSGCWSGAGATESTRTTAMESGTAPAPREGGRIERRGLSHRLEAWAGALQRTGHAAPAGAPPAVQPFRGHACSFDVLPFAWFLRLRTSRRQPPRGKGPWARCNWIWMGRGARLYGGLALRFGGKKMEEPHSLKSNEMAQCSFQPQQPLVCDTFKNCEGLSRVAFMDGNGVVMLGKVISCERKEDAAAGGKKK